MYNAIVDDMHQDLIAPCGMNCGLCVSYLARKYDLNRQGFSKTYCAGCLPRGKNCLFMHRHCERLAKGLVRFCTDCGEYPCCRLKKLDARYRSKYHMSMLDNLDFMKAHGVGAFLEQEAERWRCPGCGGVISCHNGLCLSCDLNKLRQNKKYRWGE